MNVTEQTAATKICPSALAKGAHLCCIASQCMAWRWAEKLPPTEWNTFADPVDGAMPPPDHFKSPGPGWERNGAPKRHAWCDGKTRWQQMWKRSPEAAAAHRTGYCGLAGPDMGF